MIKKILIIGGVGLAGFDLKKFMSIQIKPSQGDFNWGSVPV